MLSCLNGYRRTVAFVLVFAALLILPGSGHLGPAHAFTLAVFLGLHTFALTWLLGASPWPDIDHVLDVLLAHGRASHADQRDTQAPDQSSPSPRRGGVGGGGTS